MNRIFWIILIIGITLRLSLSAITYHSDVKAFDFTGSIIASGKILNFYDYLPSLSNDDEILKYYQVDLFIYPPLAYYFFGIMNIFANIGKNPGFYRLFLFDFPNSLNNFQLNLHLMLLKMPYLIFDIPIAFLIMKMFEKKWQLWAFTLWIFNPVDLYATYMIGQFDIIPVFLSILSLCLIFKNPYKEANLYWSALLLGIGGCFKIYPLFLLPALASLSSKWDQRIKIIILGIVPYMLQILSFLPSKGFRSSALLAGQTLKSLYAQIPLSGGESILLFLAFLIFLYLIFFEIKILRENLWERFFLILLLFFIFTHYHPQWFLWITPFLIFALIKSNFKDTLAVVIFLFSFFSLLFFFDSGLTIGLFAPLNPSLFNSQTVWQILKINVDYNFARSLLQTLFVGSAVYFIYRYFPRKEKETV